MVGKGCLSLIFTHVIGTKTSGDKGRIWTNFGDLEGKWQGAVKKGSQKSQTDGRSLGSLLKIFRKFLLPHHVLGKNWGRTKVSNLGHCHKPQEMGSKKEQKIHFPYYFHTLWNPQISWVGLFLALAWRRGEGRLMPFRSQRARGPGESSGIHLSG